jgi:protein TonB
MSASLRDVLRYPPALLLALLPVGALYWALWTLTSVEVTFPPIKAVKFDFTTVPVDTPVESIRDPKPERELPPVTPDVPRMTGQHTDMDNTVPVPPSTVEWVPTQVPTAGIDREPIPLIRVIPDYPPPAIRQGLEGWVQVQFTITATGAVTDAIVVNSSSKIFEANALKAIVRWRYNPKIEDGVGVERVGVQTLLKFELEN